MSSPHETSQQHGSGPLQEAIGRARLVILWERLWPRLVIFLGVIGIVLGASWLGFWQAVPFYARFFGVIFVGAILAIGLIPVFTIRFPGQKAALQRLDAGSGQAHRPATTSLDELATKSDPFARALWAAHQQRMQEAARSLKAGIPHPRMDQLDRYAIRILAVLLIVPAFLLAGDERMSRLLTAFDWKPPPAPVTYRIDAWVNPPPYTARAPVILQTRRTGDDRQAATTESVKVPAGSVLILRVTGNAKVTTKTAGGLSLVPQEPAAGEPSQSKETRFTIAEDGTLALEGLPDGPLSWQFNALPDRAPSIALDGQPEIDRRNQLAVPFKVEDDYGVTGAEAKFALRDAPASARPLVPAPDFALTLPQARMRTGSGVALKDFTTHPWAGAVVSMSLHASDDAGNQGRSAATSFVLPGRIFTKPIAKSLIEQRRILAVNAEDRGKVAYALESLMLASDQFSVDTATYLGLNTALLGLVRARSDADLVAVVDLLWEMALRLEDGDIAESERNVQQAAEALRQAIERGASEEEIRRLTERLREAMNRFMRELAERQMRNRAQNPQQQARRPDANTRTVRPQDLAEMLNRIENLARNGAKEQAERLMEELQRMLEGLQAGRQQDSEQAEGDNGQDSLSQLGDMIRRQQELRDQTFRRNQQQRRDRLGQPNQQENEGERSYEDIARDQEQLRQLLDQLAEQLGEQGGEEGQEGQGGQQGQQGQQGQGQQGQGQQGQQGQGQGQGQGMGQARRGLGQARRAMRDAEGALGRGQGQGAAEAQARALRGLQQGAQGLAQQMQEGQGQGQGEGRGPGNPQGRGTFSSRQMDPLGRNGSDNGLNDGDTRLNNNNRALGAARRAQDVLEELRRRLGEPHRPTGEIDYIERLLRGQQLQ